MIGKKIRRTEHMDMCVSQAPGGGLNTGLEGDGCGGGGCFIKKPIKRALKGFRTTILPSARDSGQRRAFTPA